MAVCQRFESSGFFTEGDFSGCSYRPPSTWMSGVFALKYDWKGFTVGEDFLQI